MFQCAFYLLCLCLFCLALFAVLSRINKHIRFKDHNLKLIYLFVYFSCKTDNKLYQRVHKLCFSKIVSLYYCNKISARTRQIIYTPITKHMKQCIYCCLYHVQPWKPIKNKLNYNKTQKIRHVQNKWLSRHVPTQRSWKDIPLFPSVISIHHRIT